MLNEQEIKILLSQMTEDERLKVIQMCNSENNKIKMEDIYNKLLEENPSLGKYLKTNSENNNENIEKKEKIK